MTTIYKQWKLNKSKRGTGSTLRTINDCPHPPLIPPLSGLRPSSTHSPTRPESGSPHPNLTPLTFRRSISFQTDPLPPPLKPIPEDPTTELSPLDQWRLCSQVPKPPPQLLSLSLPVSFDFYFSGYIFWPSSSSSSRAGARVGASMWRLLLLVLLCLLVMAEPRCETGDGGIVRRAFSSVSGFNDGLYSSIVGGGCEVREIKLPGKNLTGAVSWMSLTNLSSLEVVDLSMNMLKGSVPGRFWSMPSLQHVNLAGNRIGGMVRYEISPNSSSAPLSKLQLLNLSDNRFTNSIHLAGFSSLQTLDLSHNNLRSLPYGLDNLTDLKHLDLSSCSISGSAMGLSKLKSLVYLDVSENAMNGYFPSDFPTLHSIRFLNISMNNFTISSESTANFSPSAFIEASIAIFLKSPPPPSPDLNRHHRRPSTGGNSSSMKADNSTEIHKRKSSRRRHKALIIGSSSSAAMVAAVAALCLCLYSSRRRRIQSKKKKWAITKPQPPFPAIRAAKYTTGPFSFETESGTWEAEVKDPASVLVVMFEKPLMRLTFSDLLDATSGFGRESQLAEARRGGPVYRAVLPGDVHVAIKVLDRARDMATDAAAGLFEELAHVRHPNLLPLAGYCIAGTK